MTQEDPMAETVADTHSPLHDEHVALGATMTPFAGWLMPLRYSSDIAEHTAVRTAAGLFDLSHMGEIAVQGPDAAAFLDHALVGAMSLVKPMRAKYTMICAADGGIIDDLVVYRLADDEYMVVANASNAATVHGELVERRAGFSVELRDDSSAAALVAVQGPRAAEILRATAGLIGITASPDVGGAGLGATEEAIAMEEMAKVNPNLAVSVLVQNVAGSILYEYGSAEQRDIARRTIAGGCLVAIGAAAAVFGIIDPIGLFFAVAILPASAGTLLTCLYEARHPARRI